MEASSLLSLWRQDPQNKPLLTDLLSHPLLESKTLLAVTGELPSELFKDEAVVCVLVEAYFRVGLIDDGLLLNNHYLRPCSDQAFQYFRGLGYYLKGDLESAKTLLDYSTKHPSIISLQARICYQLGDIETGIQLVRSAETLEPELLGLYSMMLIDAAQYQQAFEIANQVFEREPLQLDALLALASYYTIFHKYELAIEFVNRCQSVNVNIARTWMLQGQLQLVQLQPEQARDSLLRAVELESNHIGTFHLLAWAQIFCGQLDFAKQAFEQAVEINPKFGESYGGLALIALNQDKDEEAHRLVKKALKLDPNSFSALHARSLMEERKGNMNLAVNILKDALDKPSYIEGKSYFDLWKENLNRLAKRDDGS